MSQSRTAPSPLDQFLRLPESRPSMDYYNGRAIQKMSPRLRHSIIQTEMIIKLTEHARPSRLGGVFSELRCNLGDCSFVFDLCFFLQERLPKVEKDERADVTIAPDLAIEILSPGQTIGELRQKFQAALRNGVRLGWLIAPRRKQILVFRGSDRPQVFKPGDILTGGEILPHFTISVEEIFGWLDQS
jgi:Uma2 family endonuclease